MKISRVTIDEKLVCVAMLEMDNLDPKLIESLWEDWKWAGRVACGHPARFREVKSDILHGVSWNESSDEIEYVKIRERLESMKSKYGGESLTFSTLVRSVSMAKLSNQQVKDIYTHTKGVPPAFDVNRMAIENKFRKKLKYEFFDWLKRTNDPDINMMKSLISKEKHKYAKRRKEIISLTNGTTTALQWRGHNIPDILSVVFKPENWDTNRFNHIVNFFKVANYMSNEDGFIYITIKEGDVYLSNIGGEHIVVPDKDGKIREVYRMYPWVQIISKAVHKFLDSVAKHIPGNYTYNHREWLRNIVRKGWNHTKFILGTDMEKYSDTLRRKDMMKIVEILGIPKEVVDELDTLYGLDIYDPLKIEVYEDTEATYQGQYGDFPLITLVNLCIQCFIYWKLNMAKADGYNAAVGDDTGMIFDWKNEWTLDTVIDSYGMVGVNINETKTGELNQGVGKIDFVKLELTDNGIIDFINRRNIAKRNIDAFVRDILDMENKGRDQKLNFLSKVFGHAAGERLINLSVINGGIDDHPINEDDIRLYIARQKVIRKLLGYNPDEIHDILLVMKEYFRTEYDPISEHYLCETPLVGYLDDEVIQDENLDLEQLDDKLIQTILNMNVLGNPIGAVQHYRKWLGYKPSYLHEEWKKDDRDTSKDLEASAFWDEISTYESFAAQRRLYDRERSKDTNLFTPIIDGSILYYKNLDIPDELFVGGIELDSVQDYKDTVVDYKLAKNKLDFENRIRGKLRIEDHSCFGNFLPCLRVLWTSNNEIFRLYSVITESKFHYLFEDDYDKFVRPILGDLFTNAAEFIDFYYSATKAMRTNSRFRSIYLGLSD